MGTEPARRLRGLRLVAVVLLVLGLPVAGCARGGSATLQPTEHAGQVAMDDATVATTDGQVRGVVESDHRVFQGIPYAEPPVGRMRWQPPRPVTPWRGVWDARKPGPWCIQATPGAPGAALASSEDCLTLNIWTPTGRTPERRPVMVWIHGGGFTEGSGDVYHARRLAVRGNIVVVTINYRLGALGFLAHPALGEAGNYGLADQQTALRWVRDNISAFGGDPTKVTIAGESAGGMSVCDHLAAPGSAGLFRAAIIQSGPCQAQVDLPTAQRISRDYAASVGCANPATADACLRALPAAGLAGPLWYARFGTDRLGGPVTGTPTLPVDPMHEFARGRAPAVPVLVGTTRDEFTLFVALRYLRERRELVPEDYPGVLADTFGDRAVAAVTEQYPLGAYGGNTSLAYSAAATDDDFACVADRMVDGLRRSAPAVYAYEFDDPHAPAPEIFNDMPFPLGASHALELRYLFDMGGAPPLDPAQRRLSEQMIDYWTQFVTTGVPKVAGNPEWPDVGEGRDRRWLVLRPGGPRVITDFAAEHHCTFWSTLKR